MENQITSQSPDTNFIIKRNIDFMLHLLAHIDTKNVATIYDKNCVAKFTTLRNNNGVFATAMSELSCESFAYISFLPVYLENITDVYNVLTYLVSMDKKHLVKIPENFIPLLDYISFAEQDREELGKFLILAAKEEEFYFTYWESELEDFQHRMAEFEAIWESKAHQLIKEFFFKHNKNQFNVFLSEAMLKNGRGVSFDQLSVNAVTKLHNCEEELYHGYYIAVHEMIHQVSDQVVMEVMKIGYDERSLNSDDESFNIHMHFEYAVIYLHYQLSKKQGTAMEELFLKETSQYGQSISSEEELLNFCNLTKELKEKLDELI